jgi:hypothetical protein
MNLHSAIGDLCSSCEEVGRLSQAIDLMYAKNEIEDVYSKEEVSKRESEVHVKICRCNNLRVEIEGFIKAELKRGG